MDGLGVDDIYTAVASDVGDKGGSVRETKKSAEAANDSKREGNKYFRKMTTEVLYDAATNVPSHEMS